MKRESKWSRWMVKRVKCFAIMITIVFIVLTPIVQAAPIPESLKDTYQKALDSDRDAQYVMGRFYLKKESPGADPEAEKWLMPAAVKGEADARFYLGRMYQRGLINADLEKSDQLKKWVKLLRGQYHDAKVHANERVAGQLFEKAAAQGHEQAMDYLEGEKSFKGWFFLIFGTCALPISVGIFIWPEVAATLPRRALSLPHHPLIIRFLSAPLLFLFAVAFIYYGVQALGWFG